MCCFPLLLRVELQSGEEQPLQRAAEMRPMGVQPAWERTRAQRGTAESRMKGEAGQREARRTDLTPQEGVGILSSPGIAAGATGAGDADMAQPLLNQLSNPAQ